MRVWRVGGGSRFLPNFFYLLLYSAGFSQCARALPALSLLQFVYVKNSPDFLIFKPAATAGTFKLFLEDVYLKIKR